MCVCACVCEHVCVCVCARVYVHDKKPYLNVGSHADEYEKKYFCTDHSSSSVQIMIDQVSLYIS